MKLTEFISDVGRPVAFYPGLRRITGSTTATLFLCQLIYWTGKQADPDGWIYKESKEIEEETGLSYGEQATARKQLVKAGLIEEQYKRLDHKMTFRIMANAINEKWRNGESAFGEEANQEMGKAAIASSLIESESTSETTAEKSAPPVTIDPFDAMRQTVERLTGYPSPSTVKEIEAINQFVTLEVTEQDIMNAIAFFKETGATARGAAHLLKSVMRARADRVQSTATYKKQKSPSQSRLNY